MKIKLSKTEKAIIQKHTPAVRGRALLELEIVNALIYAAGDANYYFAIEGVDGDDISSDSKFKRALFDLDDAFILVFAEDKTPKGWIKLVFSNNGYDLISDYSTSLESFLKPVNDLAKFWGN